MPRATTNSNDAPSGQVASYVAFDRLGGRRNVIVDGAATAGTVLTLSHWPGSDTPAELLRDTSTEIVLEFLRQGGLAARGLNDVAVSNNHFDEDGLLGVWVILNPEEALKRERLLTDAAHAGDFGVVRSDEAAWVALAIASLAEGRADPYQELLPLLCDLLDRPQEYARWWRPGFDAYQASRSRLLTGSATIDEQADLDLAVVRSAEPLDALAVNTATACNRVVEIVPGRIDFRYRYESWVRYVSRPIPSRVDLTPLAAELNRIEQGTGRWVFDGVDDIVPRLHCHAGHSTMPEDQFLATLATHLSRDNTRGA